MSWKKVKLGDIATVTSSKRIFARQYTNTGIPFYRQKEIIDKKNKLEITEPLFISKNTYLEIKNKFGAPQKGDLLITAVGVTLGIAYVVRDEEFYFKDGNLIWLKDFIEEVNSHYIYYWVNSDVGQKSMWSRTIGSAQPALTIDTIKQFEIKLPTLNKQNKIADILSNYDNLIENNQKQIKLLEEATQRLYKEWFVDLHFPGYESATITDGVPEGWCKKAVDEIAEYINGFAFKPSDWGDRGMPIIKIKEMGNGVTSDTPRNDGNTIPQKYHIVSGDILFSWSATLSAMIWSGEDGLLNQHIFKVVPRDGICREFVLQSILFTLNEFMNLTTGATMKHIQRGKLKEVFVYLPDEKTMSEYGEISKKVRNKILLLEKQIIHLTEARDRLLPKLMSGEIEV